METNQEIGKKQGDTNIVPEKLLSLKERLERLDLRSFSFTNRRTGTLSILETIQRWCHENRYTHVQRAVIQEIDSAVSYRIPMVINIGTDVYGVDICSGTRTRALLRAQECLKCGVIPLIVQWNIRNTKFDYPKGSIVIDITIRGNYPKKRQRSKT